jgi:Stress responsive A/B Barrel Domain
MARRWSLRAGPRRAGNAVVLAETGGDWSSRPIFPLKGDIMRWAVLGIVLALGGIFVSEPGIAADGGKNESHLGKVRHVVLFKFKDDTTAEQKKTIEDAFRALPKQIPEIVDFEWGTNISPENHDQGYTHCFLVTFNDSRSRDAYLPHPAHKAFGKVLHPYLDKVLVIDFVAKD